MILGTRIIKLVKTLFIVSFAQLLFSKMALVYAQDITHSSQAKTNLQDKHYRQALYFYFQGDSANALASVGQSRAKLTELDSRSSLFEAGLQLSVGLLQPAKQTLLHFDGLLEKEAALQNDEDEENKNSKASAKAEKLRLIALLSLTDQYLQQGSYEQAKDTLTKIDAVSTTYYPQYHLLSQLAYWPEEITLLTPQAVDDEQEISSPYIQLNEALRLIEQSEIEQAILLLNAIKVATWHKKGGDFWKTLFLNEADFSTRKAEKDMEIKQGQAIQDYAKLLLAQIYISQQRYQSAFNELKTFPQFSPYTESAGFLFAFASQQVKQYDTAFSLLNLLHNNYPHSSLGWQSAELMAQQVTEQQSLEQGVSSYQNVESFFLAQQKSLSQFNTQFDESDDLLAFSMPDKLTDEPTDELSNQQDIIISSYQPESLWLQKALYDAELASLYQKLLDIDVQIAEINQLLEKTQWLAEIISLNQQRKSNIVAIKDARQHDEVLANLVVERDRLAEVLEQQLSSQSSIEFVSAKEQRWLQRIENSNNALASIGDQKNTEEYKERLARVTGVLSWQLSEEFPVRAWQHKKHLLQLNQAITNARDQLQQVETISSIDDQLNKRISKHKDSINHLTTLLAQAQSLRSKVSTTIRSQVKTFIEEQNLLLASHLLSTRQGMAKVLEQMENVDRRLSSKLTAVRPQYDAPNNADISSTKP